MISTRGWYALSLITVSVLPIQFPEEVSGIALYGSIPSSRELTATATQRTVVEY